MHIETSGKNQNKKRDVTALSPFFSKLEVLHICVEFLEETTYTINFINQQIRKPVSSVQVHQLTNH